MGSQKPKEEPEAAYTRQQFLESSKYAKYGDVLNALLNDQETYTINQVEQAIKAFLEKEAE